MNWMRSALCAQIGDLDLFYPPRGGSSTIAKRLCQRCPVRQPCLDYALTVEANADASDRFGIYGGRSGKERHRIAHGDDDVFTRTCAGCGQEFEPGHASRIYCDTACNKRAYRRRVRETQRQRMQAWEDRRAS